MVVASDSARGEFVIGCIAGMVDCIALHWVDTLKENFPPPPLSHAHSLALSLTHTHAPILNLEYSLINPPRSFVDDR